MLNDLVEKINKNDYVSYFRNLPSKSFIDLTKTQLVKSSFKRSPRFFLYKSMDPLVDTRINIDGNAKQFTMAKLYFIECGFTIGYLIEMPKSYHVVTRFNSLVGVNKNREASVAKIVMQNKDISVYTDEDSSILFISNIVRFIDQGI